MDKGRISTIGPNIKELKDGVYGKIEESNFWFIDITAIKRAKAKSIEYDDNFGGRCVSLLSLNKILIQKVHIYESTLKFEYKRLGTKDLRIIMKTNGIRRNECLSKKVKKFKTIFDW